MACIADANSWLEPRFDDVAGQEGDGKDSKAMQKEYAEQRDEHGHDQKCISFGEILLLIVDGVENILEGWKSQFG